MVVLGGRRFLLSEVPEYAERSSAGEHRRTSVSESGPLAPRGVAGGGSAALQGFLTYKKTQPP